MLYHSASVLRAGQTANLSTSLLRVRTLSADLSGGFYTEGDMGPVKVTSHVAWSTSLLAWSLLEYEVRPSLTHGG